MTIGLILTGAFLAGFLGTWTLRRYALRRNLVDVPNERSSHAAPTPRGGGLAITFVVLLAILWLAGRQPMTETLLVSLLPAAALIALIGWLDDHFKLSVLWRAGCYLVAAIWLVVLSGGLPEISVGQQSITLGVLNIPLLALAIAWLINLYNFMDGADGLAGIQAVTAGTAGAFMLWHDATGLALLAAIIAAATAGFLVWNRPPARIFMGDVGSCFLGFLFGCLALLGEQQAGLPALLWLMLLGFFFWDSTLTLLKRMLFRERWYRAHRSHAYQRLLQLGWSHKRLAGAFLFYNLLVSWPLAAWAYYRREMLPAAVLTSMVVTISVWGIVQLWYCKSKGELS